ETVALAARDAIVAVARQRGAARIAHALHRLTRERRTQRMAEIAERDRTLAKNLERLMADVDLMAADHPDQLVDPEEPGASALARTRDRAARAETRGCAFRAAGLGCRERARPLARNAGRPAAGRGPARELKLRVATGLGTFRASVVRDGPPAPAPIERSIRRGEDDYPAALLDLAHPPGVIHVRGALPPAGARAVAIVGSRAATPYGLERAGRLAADLARLGLVIVSGLARGIDAAAHRCALEAGGVTVAVLPGGLDAITPATHLGLAQRIARRGALLSEWPAAYGVRPGLFVRRNRLIAALSQATVVVEAAEKSGALSTAAVARRLGRPLLAVPGDVDRPTSRGCNALLRAGAH